MEARERYELLTRLARLEREVLFVRRRLKEDRSASVLPGGTRQGVRIQVGMQEFAIASAYIRQIVRYAPPSLARGSLYPRDDGIPVIDLGDRLGLGTTEAGSDAALMIVCVHDVLIGLVIQRVLDAVQLDGNEPHALDLDGLISASELELLTLSVPCQPMGAR